MIIRVYIKHADAFHDAVNEAVRADVESVDVLIRTSEIT